MSAGQQLVVLYDRNCLLRVVVDDTLILLVIWKVQKICAVRSAKGVEQ